jgi:hypothetical protein
MKLTVLGSLVFVAAVTSGLAAQGPNAASTERTIMGCVAGDGSDATPWMLTGVIIPPPAPPPGAGGGRGGGGGRGAGGGAGREGGPPQAGGPPPAGGPAAAGGPPAAGGQGGGGRGARGGAPAAPAGPPPPPPVPQSFKLTGITMTPWAHMRAEVTGAGTNGDFKVLNVRSMFGGGCQ